jgi:Got1/Sft2-like family
MNRSNFIFQSRLQRIIGFVGCLGMGLFCFGLSLLYLPVLVLKARKFALLFTMGSLFSMIRYKSYRNLISFLAKNFNFSFSFLWGIAAHWQHLTSKERLPFSACYVISLAATVYCSMVAQSTPLTCLCAVLQVVALVWFLLSYVPNGHTGLQFLVRLCTSSMGRSLPV